MRAFLLAWILSCAPAPSWAFTAQEILQRADTIRMPDGSYLLNVQVVSKKAPPSPPQTGTYEVYLQGKQKTLIKTMAPKTDRGTTLLMLDHDLWVFLPDISKPVRVSMQQRLLGDVANGDLARANFSGDYTPKLLKNAKTFYQLELTAKSEDITYGKVQLWVDKKTFRPLRAAFYASSGRLLKVGSYEDYRELAGRARPGRLVLTDAIRKDQTSTITYLEMNAQPSLPDKFFTKDYLKKFKY